jgi:hypothetical protein
MPKDTYMDREVASVAGLKYYNAGRARVAAEQATAKETKKSNGNGNGQAVKQSRKRSRK